MGAGKDDPRATEFMVLFRELCDRTHDDPLRLQAMARDNEALKRLCLDLQFSAYLLEIEERQHRALFRQPENSGFVEAWRTYEEYWGSIVFDISCDEILAGIDIGGVSEPDARDEFTRRWEVADEEARNVAGGLDMAMDRATESVEFGSFREGYAESIDEAVREFRLLPQRIGLDLRGVLRRRSLTPVALIPAHVAKRHDKKHGPQPDSKISLLLQLQQAQEAFILGVPLAAISLMRGLTELVLVYHYDFATGNLDKKIGQLPQGRMKDALHRLRMLANDVLHYGEDRSQGDDFRQARLNALATYAASLSDHENSPSKDAVIETERELISYLLALRRLIEEAPTHATVRR